MDGQCLVLITCGDSAEASEISHQLVESRLAAGVQIVPIESIYRWDGEIVEDHEWLMLVKTRRDRFEEIESVVLEMHSYEVPPVLMVAMDAGSNPYLDWVAENTSG
ncbi:MAG TPA: divalent-cation tolerance protein CutA [Acidimicrobiia bacterium]|nr:divalent-cation tolerance protein CutA [Acidimicrobiia bacterium]